MAMCLLVYLHMVTLWIHLFISTESVRKVDLRLVQRLTMSYLAVRFPAARCDRCDLSSSHTFSWWLLTSGTVCVISALAHNKACGASS